MNTVPYSDYCGNSPMGYVNGWHSKLREERYTFGDLCSQYTHTHTHTHIHTTFASSKLLEFENSQTLDEFFFLF